MRFYILRHWLHHLLEFLIVIEDSFEFFLSFCLTALFQILFVCLRLNIFRLSSLKLFRLIFRLIRILTRSSWSFLRNDFRERGRAKWLTVHIATDLENFWLSWFVFFWDKARVKIGLFRLTIKKHVSWDGLNSTLAEYFHPVFDISRGFRLDF